MLLLTQKLENILLKGPAVSACCCSKLGPGLTCSELVLWSKGFQDANASVSCSISVKT